MKPFSNKRKLVAQLKAAGFEFDQQLQRAFELSASRPDITPEDTGFPDSYLTLALYRLNTVLTRVVNLKQDRYNLFHEYKMAPPCKPEDVVPGSRLCRVLDEAVRLTGPDKVIGVGHFIRAIVTLTLDTKAWRYPGHKQGTFHNTFSAETLMIGLGHSAWTDVDKAPEVERLLKTLDGRDPVNDHEYIMTVQGDRIIFRATSVVDTFTMLDGASATRNRTGILTHFCDNYTGFLPADLLHFEDLINHPRASELDLQKFFEHHPQLLRLWEYRDVYPQVFLTREEDGDLIPDFLLTDPDLQRAMILDLKLPNKRIAVGPKDRRRLSAPVLEAKAQLTTYRDWFAEKSNREKIKDRLGMEIYQPKLAVVIGRKADFIDDLDRQRIVGQHSDLEVLTYDDVLEFAKRRILLLQNASRG